MFKTKSFPSVFEASTSELIDVANDLVTGLKLEYDGRSYIIGELALIEGNSPNKVINHTPSDLDYQLLMQAALTVAKIGAEEPMTVTTGFPYSTFSAYQNDAEAFLRGTHEIELDGRTFGRDEVTHMSMNVGEVEIIPEIQGLETVVREGDLNEREPFFAIGLGYGTFEAALSLPSGLVQRTATSGNGVVYATELLKNELQREHSLNMLTDHQIDVAMQEGSIVLGRQRKDLTDLRRDVLHTYYDDIISPALRRAFDDNDFGRATKMYLGGGGMHYDEIVQKFEEEFGGIVDLQVIPEPEQAISRGYALHAAESGSGERAHAAGIDVGNATTIINLFEQKDDF